jgi:3-phosphoshikimate 1-carboxyvinyltransferase
MKLLVHPGTPLKGTVHVPGDKSLSHRAVLFAALAEGESRIKNFLISGVTRVMLNSLVASGVDWRLNGAELALQGLGLHGFKPAAQPLNCGNSATTIRLLAGGLAATGVAAVLDGSAGLRLRPMDRIVEPLLRMGVPIAASEGGVAPLTLHQRDRITPLKALNETMPVASAQVKSCLLLAALAARGETILREPGPSRDHTERMLRSMGVVVETNTAVVNGITVYETHLQPPHAPLKPIDIILPGDMSAAAFLIVAGLITPGSELFLPGVGLNPTRTGLIDALREMGGQIEVHNLTSQAGEPMGDLVVKASDLHGIEVSGAQVVRMIDEFSVFGAAAAFAQGKTLVKDAAELRYKESDRIHTLAEELGKLGVVIEEMEDGFRIEGGTQPPLGGTVISHGDHRLAMAMAILGLNAGTKVCIDGAEIIAESFPEFVDTLISIGADAQILSPDPEPM